MTTDSLYGVSSGETNVTDDNLEPQSKGFHAHVVSPPRLMITKMVLENFKSYAGVKEIGPFHKCFSCVVGPNGSGKSNVIDAMLFVFGKRAKKLRLNKVSELIHSSQSFKDTPLEYARVSVHFQEIVDTGDGQDDFIIIPNTEIVVTRIAKRDNSSIYKLDGRNCSFKDVAKYLNEKGIDLDNNRFLILQGEVEMISMMPPKGKADNDSDGGLLEYLEDIIGSNVYVERTNEAAAKVEGLTEQRQEKLNRVKAVEKEKESLEAAKLEAEALIRKQGEIRRKKNILYQLNIFQIKQDMDDAKLKNQELIEKLEQERITYKTTDERVREIERELKGKQTEHDRSHAELIKTKDEFTSYERRDVKLREDIKHTKEQKTRLESKVLNEEKKEEESLSKERSAQESIPTLEKLVEKLNQEKAENDAKLESIFDERKEEIEKLRAQLEKKTLELAPIAQERALFQVALDTATMEVKLLEDSSNRSKDQLMSAEKELAALDGREAALRTELSKCEDELQRSKKRLTELSEEDMALSQQEENLSSSCTDLMVRSEEAKAALQSLSVMSEAVAGILKASAANGELSKVGILGRLGDLATIDEKYDVAVSTACGFLDHIVVHTTAGAQRCLEFLRRHNLGRANFIPLDKLKKGAHDRAVETPEGAPRLFDLITPKHFTATPALYLGVGNTLVAPDLETATRWAYDFDKRWRVVTLDGSLIELSGTMQGGGNSVQRGRMKLSNSKSNTHIVEASNLQSREDCAKLELLASEAHENLKVCRNRRRMIADEIRDLNKSIKALSVKLPKLGMELNSCDTSREELVKRIPELREQCILSPADEEKLVTLKMKVSKCKADMASCAMIASKLEADVARIQKLILDASGPKLKKQQQECDKIVAALDIAMKEINCAKVAISSSQKAAEKARQSRYAAKKDLEKCVVALDKQKEELLELEHDATLVMEAYEKVKEVELVKRQELEALNTECEELKKIQSKVKCAELELVAKLDHYNKMVKDHERRIRQFEEEIGKLSEDDNEDAIYEVSDDEESAESTVNTAEAKKLPLLSNNALSLYNSEDLKRDILVLEKERDSIAKNANMGAISEYRKKEEDYLARIGELDSVSEARNEARKQHEELRRQRLEMFMNGFGQITLKLKEMYQMITLGGDAELELVDSLDPFSEGIVFSVRPPKKSWKNISNLSGGEKTLSSLALVFALHHYKPTPLYVMDEIDAALDFKNVSIVANYIKDRTKNAQFIIISLRNNMFELADRLVGIYKTNHCTKSITIDPKAFADAIVKTKPVALTDCTNTNAGTNELFSH